MEEMKKENGDALNDKTERGMEKVALGEQKGSAELGKFKDVNALLQAYTALEAEFTRRSQRLKALEREAENGKAEVAKELNAVAEGDEAANEVVNEEKCAVSQTESLTPTAAPKECTTNMTEVRKPEVGMAEAEAKKEEGSFSSTVRSVRNTEKNFADDELYSAVLANEAVRLKVIGEYLSSIGKNGAPMVKGGTGTLAVQPARAESIASAGAMALRMFKNANIQA